MTIESKHVNEDTGHAENPCAAPDNSQGSIWRPALKEARRWFLASALGLTALYGMNFERIHPEFASFIGRDAHPLTAYGKDFIPVSIGKGHRIDQTFVVEDFNNDEAILALPRAFQAEDYPFIKVNLSGLTRFSVAKILWQREDEPQTHALELNRSGDKVTQVAMVQGGDNYSGRISSIALLIYDGPESAFENNNDVDIAIESIEFLPFSLLQVATQISQDWLNPPTWQPSSVNKVEGAHKNAILFPNTALNVVVFTCLTIVVIRYLLSPRSLFELRRGRLVRVTMCILLLSWIANECLRWHWRIEQLVNAHERYAGLPYSEKIRASKVRCTMFPDDCASYLLPYF